MKKYTVPILTEEYKVNVFIGRKKELIKHGEKYCNDKNFSSFFNGRGLTVNGFDFKPVKPPAIFVDGDLPYPIAIATLAHEASHAVDYLIDFLGIKDSSGELLAHGIAAIMRHSLKGIK